MYFRIVYSLCLCFFARAQTLQAGGVGPAGVGGGGGAAVARLSSISSQDSGFVSQDTLHLKPPTPPLDFRRKVWALDVGGW